MQITLTFDGMEEFLRYVDMRGKINTTFTDFSPAEIRETLTRRLDATAGDRGTGAIVGATPEEQRQEEAREAAQAAAVPEKKPKTKKNPPKEEKPAEEPTAAQEEAPAKAPEDLEKLRPKARKILSELNEATGTNTARQLIKKLGAENLKMLPAEKLPELIKMAEEDLADAQ
jgi:hypothetical protein